jgi:Na+-translocating ferredoxin:NAD+ oxidoreductase RnfD subunit
MLCGGWADYPTYVKYALIEIANVVFPVIWHYNRYDLRLKGADKSIAPDMLTGQRLE